LLKQNSLYVLSPYIELAENVIAKSDEERADEGVLNCDGCGKVLDSEYHILIGIPPSPLVIETYRCKSMDQEKIIDFDKIVTAVQYTSKFYDIDSKYQWIFSEQNIIGSKTRLCVNCKEESAWERWERWEILDIHLCSVCFAVKEYQRRHIPLSAAKSDCERYILSLPDRTNLIMQHFGDVDINDDGSAGYYTSDMVQRLTMALIPDYDLSNGDGLTYEFASQILQELRTDFIQDKDRIIPNDQELTRWMKKMNDMYDDYGHGDWFKIQFCKIFENPKALGHPKRRGDGKEVYNTRYTVVVHYSVPKGYWEEFDI
jgi:hypothetical protein